MRGVAIVSPVRTAVGNFGGSLRDVSAAELASTVIKAALERSGVDPSLVDDVILGHGYPSGENPAIGRLAGLKAGLPIEVPGYQLDRRCSSGLQAILNASMLVQTDNADVVIAGGVESMSGAEFYNNESRWGARFGSVTFHDRLARARVTITPEERFGPYPAAWWKRRKTWRSSTKSRGRSRTSLPCVATSAPWPPATPAGSTPKSCPSAFPSVAATPNPSIPTKAHAPTPLWMCWVACAR